MVSHPALLRQFFVMWQLSYFLSLVSCKYVVEDNLWKPSHIPISYDEYDDPTDEEISRAVSYDYEYWGDRLYEDKSLRMIAFGGSNTAQHGKSYADVLNDYLQAHHEKNSYCINAGIPGSSACVAVDSRLHIFDEIPRDFWPNVVILEFSINCDNRGRQVQDPVGCLDKLINSIREKYRFQSLDEPYFMSLELFRIDPWIFKPFPGKENVMTRVDTFGAADVDADNLKMDRGCPCCKFLTSVSRFYGIPYVSNADALFPAFTRFYLNNTATDWTQTVLRWKYFLDGGHLNHLGGFFVSFKLILPYIFRKIERAEIRAEHNPLSHSFVKRRYNLYDYDLRLYESNYYANGVLLEWSIWGSQLNLTNVLPASISAHIATQTVKKDINFLQYSSSPKDSWKIVSTKEHIGKPDLLHNCYGGKQVGSKALFHFHAPEECGKKFTCKVYMDYIHSWNMKHFGDTKCSLFSIYSSSHATTPIGHDLDIIGHLGGEGKTMQTTVPLSHMVTDQNIVGGSYLLQCQVMVEKRVSCIPRVQIRYNYSM